MNDVVDLAIGPGLSRIAMAGSDDSNNPPAFGASMEARVLGAEQASARLNLTVTDPSCGVLAQWCSVGLYDWTQIDPCPFFGEDFGSLDGTKTILQLLSTRTLTPYRCTSFSSASSACCLNMKDLIRACNSDQCCHYIFSLSLSLSLSLSSHRIK